MNWLNTLLNLILACFEVGIGYDLNGIEGTAAKVRTKEECQQRCKDEEMCKVFVYVTEGYHDKREHKMCYLKATDVGKNAQEGLISGPKTCEGKIS